MMRIMLFDFGKEGDSAALYQKYKKIPVLTN